MIRAMGTKKMKGGIRKGPDKKPPLKSTWGINFVTSGKGDQSKNNDGTSVTEKLAQLWDRRKSIGRNYDIIG